MICPPSGPVAARSLLSAKQEQDLNSTSKSPVLAGVLAVGLTAVAWFFLPVTQSGPKRVEAEAYAHIERARRLLDRYNANLTYRSLVLDQLRDSEVAVDAKDASENSEEIGDDYQAAHQALWAAFEPRDWEDGVGRPARATYGNLAGQMRDGAAARSELVKENSALLDDAMKEIDAALQVQAGGATGEGNAEAQRLKAVVLYHRGLSEQVAARVKRDDMVQYISELDALANEATQLKALRGILPDSRIDEQIAKTRADLTQAEARVAESKARLAKLSATIEGLETKLASAQSQYKAARVEIDRLKAAGVDFSDPQGANKFAQNLEDQFNVYRTKLREAQEIQAGSLPNAEIDVTGDYLKGRYLEGESKTLTVEPGLSHYRVEHASLAAKIAHEQAGVDAIRSDLARLELGRRPYEAQEALAAQRLPEIEKAATEAYADLSRVDSEASAIEEKGLKYLDQSIAASQQAATLAETWVAAGREQTENLSPEAKERSAGNSRSNDAWLGGFINAQIADARTVKAWIQFDRLNAAKRMASALERLTNQLPLREVDLASLQTKMQSAEQASIKEIESAMAILEKAHKAADRHWTFTAQGAGITYLMVLLGRDDYLADTIEAYRAAIKGRESEAVSQRFADRLKLLEARQP